MNGDKRRIVLFPMLMFKNWPDKNTGVQSPLPLVVHLHRSPFFSALSSLLLLRLHSHRSRQASLPGFTNDVSKGCHCFPTIWNGHRDKRSHVWMQDDNNSKILIPRTQHLNGMDIFKALPMYPSLAQRINLHSSEDTLVMPFTYVP